MNNYMSSIEQLCAGPLVRSLLNLAPTVPKSPHYDSLATGIASLLGTVDPRLIEDAMAERAAGVTLH